MTAFDEIDGDKMTRSGRGANAALLRNHNERAILTLLRAHDLSGKELADALGVSAQTASVITRKLEAAQLIVKGSPKKGKVGKPQTPWALNPEGAYGIGLRIGRRSADFILMDMVGQTQFQKKTRYRYPTPQAVNQILRDNMAIIRGILGSAADRITGFGIAAPYELWSWIEAFDSHAKDLDAWRDYSFEAAIAEFSDLPVFVANDVTMACNGELLYGVGKGLANFAYFYVGTLIGGGVVIDGQIFQGPRGNAGAFASMPIANGPSNGGQLANFASLAVLESELAQKLGRETNLGADPTAWAEAPDSVARWMNAASIAIATASLSVISVLDVPQIVIDGGLPETIKRKLTQQIEARFSELSQRGIHPSTFLTGSLGDAAGALGAANLPLLNAHFLEGTQIV